MRIHNLIFLLIFSCGIATAMDERGNPQVTFTFANRRNVLNTEELASINKKHSEYLYRFNTNVIDQFAAQEIEKLNEIYAPNFKLQYEKQGSQNPDTATFTISLHTDNTSPKVVHTITMPITPENPAPDPDSNTRYDNIERAILLQRFRQIHKKMDELESRYENYVTAPSSREKNISVWERLLAHTLSPLKKQVNNFFMEELGFHIAQRIITVTGLKRWGDLRGLPANQVKKLQQCGQHIAYQQELAHYIEKINEEGSQFPQVQELIRMLPPSEKNKIQPEYNKAVNNYLHNTETLVEHFHQLGVKA